MREELNESEWKIVRESERERENKKTTTTT